MNITIHELQNPPIAGIKADSIILASEQDAVDIIMNCRYLGADHIIVESKNIDLVFFDLKSKVASDILQKFSTYQAFLAIIGDFENIQSKSLQDFVRESNRMGRIHFVANLNDAFRVFTKKQSS